MTLLFSVLALIVASGAIWLARNSIMDAVFIEEQILNSIRDENQQFMDKMEPCLSEFEDRSEELSQNIKIAIETRETLQVTVNELKRETREISSSLSDLDLSIPQKLRISLIGGQR